MKTMQRQRGMTGIGWILVFALIAFFTLVAVKILPIYISSMTVSSVLSDMETEPGLGNKTPGQVLTTFSKRMSVNTVSDVSRDDVTIERSGRIMTIYVDYEVRRKFVGNIDVVLSFNKKAEIPIP